MRAAYAKHLMDVTGGAKQLTITFEYDQSKMSGPPFSVPAEEVQGTLRVHPEAFLAPSVLICEGATEVGFVRGLDQHCQNHGKPSLHAIGVALVDCDGGDAERTEWRGAIDREVPPSFCCPVSPRSTTPVS